MKKIVALELSAYPLLNAASLFLTKKELYVTCGHPAKQLLSKLCEIQQTLETPLNINFHKQTFLPKLI